MHCDLGLWVSWVLKPLVSLLNSVTLKCFHHHYICTANYFLLRIFGGGAVSLWSSAKTPLLCAELQFRATEKGQGEINFSTLLRWLCLPPLGRDAHTLRRAATRKAVLVFPLKMNENKWSGSAYSWHEWWDEPCPMCKSFVVNGYVL